MGEIKVKSSLFRKGWPVSQVGFVPYLLDAADDWGLIRENPAMFAAALNHKDEPVSEEDVTRWLDRLTSPKVETFLRYSEEGVTYLATPKWQDNQGRKYFSKSGPECPIPPLEVFRKLSVKSRQNFRHCFSKLPPPIAVAVADAVAVAGDIDSCDGRNPRRSARLTPEQNAFKQALLDLWSESQRAYYRVPADKAVKFQGGIAAAHFSAWAREPKDLELCKTAMAIYFKRRADFRERERKRAREGELPPIVGVDVKYFIGQIEALYEEARRLGGDER